MNIINGLNKYNIPDIVIIMKYIMLYLKLVQIVLIVIFEFIFSMYAVISFLIIILSNDDVIKRKTIPDIIPNTSRMLSTFIIFLFIKFFIVNYIIGLLILFKILYNFIGEVIMKKKTKQKILRVLVWIVTIIILLFFIGGGIITILGR